MLKSDKRSDWFPDTPIITELAPSLTTDQQKRLAFVEATAPARGGFAPPGISEDKLQFLRDAFDEIVAMKGFKRQVSKFVLIWEEPVPGEKMEESIISLMTDVTKADIDKLIEITESYE